MKTNTLSSTKLSVLFILAWVAVIAIYTPSEINAQFVREFEFCSPTCVNRVLGWKSSIAWLIESIRTWVFQLLYGVTGFEVGEEGFERIYLTLLQPESLEALFDTLHTLLLLIAVRIGAMAGFFKVLSVLAFAGILDALTQRKIASVSFHASMPVVSFWALIVVKVLPLVAFVCLLIPASGMQLAAVGLLVGAMVATAVWLRHFHRFER